MDNIIKIGILITNGFTLLGKKIDALSTELKNKKQPIINIPQPRIDVKLPDNLRFPSIPTPQVHVNVPDVVFDASKIPAPIVNVPPVNITVNPTPVEFPKEIKVEGMDKLLEGVNRETPEINFRKDITSKNALPVMIVDKKGRHIEDFASELTAPSVVGLRVGTTLVDESHPLSVTTDGFAIPKFDTQIIDEALAPATTVITYKLAGVTVATKTITVSGTTTTITVT